MEHKTLKQKEEGKSIDTRKKGVIRQPNKDISTRWRSTQRPPNSRDEECPGGEGKVRPRGGSPQKCNLCTFQARLTCVCVCVCMCMCMCVHPIRVSHITCY